MKRSIEMTGPMLRFSGGETGEATLRIDLCKDPATVRGSGTSRFEGEGRRSSVRLKEEGEGEIALDGRVFCGPGIPVTVRWLESWRSTQRATWPGGGRTFESSWDDSFLLEFPYRTGEVEIASDQTVTYPRTAVDTTTSATTFAVNVCVSVCDPSRIVDELQDHLLMADGWRRAISQIRIHPSANEPLSEYRARIEAWIDETSTIGDATVGPGPTVTPDDVDGAQAVAPSSRRLRVDPGTCAVEHLKPGGGWETAARPISRDCVLEAVAVKRVLTERARCLAVRQCQVDPDLPVLAGVDNCFADEALDEIYRENAIVLKVREADAQCGSAARLLWWLEQHAACNTIDADLPGLKRRFEEICATSSTSDSGAERDGDPWPNDLGCNEYCRSRHESELEIDVCTFECSRDRLADSRQQSADAFADFDDRANDLFGQLLRIMRESEERSTGIIRNVRD